LAAPLPGDTEDGLGLSYDKERDTESENGKTETAAGKLPAFPGGNLPPRVDSEIQMLKADAVNPALIVSHLPKIPRLNP